MERFPVRKAIFVVDDEPLIAKTLGLILRQHGLDVRVFCDPAVALAAAAKTHLDLLLTDVDMPTMDGVKLASSVSLLHPHCPIVFLSGRISPSPADDSSSHQWCFLSKPIDPPRLLNNIRTMLAGSALEQATVSGLGSNLQRDGANELSLI